MNPLYRFLLAFGLTLACLPACADPAPGSLDVHWNEGAADCTKAPQPPLQVHRYNAQTFILRESPCVTFEAPFMYLLIGSSRALLIDTGDVADPKQVPLAKTVMDLLPEIGDAKMPLIVVHTHGHLDHRAGDPQFQSLPHVQIVQTDLEHVKQYFGFTNWPNGVSRIELGDRAVDVLPTPGHYPSHVSYYDRNTALFFSGDFFLPGRLLIDDTEDDIRSAQRAADFIRDRPVSHVLGGHIELDAQGNTFDFGVQLSPQRTRVAVDQTGSIRPACHRCPVQRLLHPGWDVCDVEPISRVGRGIGGIRGGGGSAGDFDLVVHPTPETSAFSSRVNGGETPPFVLTTVDHIGVLIAFSEIFRACRHAYRSCLSPYPCRHPVAPC